MISGPPSLRRRDPFEPEFSQIERIGEPSITRTGLFSSIPSSRHSENSELCPRSAPSTKRFIRSPANHGRRFGKTHAYFSTVSGSRPSPGATVSILSVLPRAQPSSR
jgi:hypothetical protein